MNRSIVILAALLGLVPLLWTAARYMNARGEAAVTAAQWEIVADQARELVTLRSEAPPESRRPRPAPGIAARLAGVVAAAGLPQGVLQNVTPEQESAVNGGKGAAYRRLAVRLTMDPVTLPELGRFFAQWRGAEPTWLVTSVDLSPTSRHARGTQKPLRAALVIETVFHEDAVSHPRAVP